MAEDLAKEEETPSWWFRYAFHISILIASCIGYYLVFLNKRNVSLFGLPCRTPRFVIFFKKLWALFTIWRYRVGNIRKPQPNPLASILPTEEDEILEKRTRPITGCNSDLIRIYGFDQEGNSVGFSMAYYSTWYEVMFQLRLSDGSVYLHTTVPIPLIGNPDAKKSEWEGGGLKFEVLQPLRRFRVTFNGLLMKNDSTVHHVRINFIWSACGPLIDLRNDWSSSLVAEALAREAWKQHEWYHLLNDQGSGFDQWGAMRGEVVIDSSEPVDLNLPSLRQRRWGPAEAHTLTRRLGLTGFTKDGTLFYIRATCSPLGLTYAKFGHVWLPNQTQASITRCDIGLQNLSANPTSHLPKNMLVSFIAKRKHYRVFATLEPEYKVYGQSFIARISPVQLSLNDDCGFGAAEFWYRAEDVHVEKPIKMEPEIPEESSAPVKDIIVAFFKEKSAQNSNLTGGKGSSLAVLTSLKSDKFKVPQGFCVTVNAFELQLKENRNLLRGMNALTHFDQNDLKDKCEYFTLLLKTTPMSRYVQDKVLEALSELENLSLAVRSSAVGEDSEEFSAAGQNSTFLGVKDKLEVLKAIQECWASAYSYQSVQYRREHSQPIRCKMAVVVQEMVPAEKAGVLFTRNPLSGDPRNVVITANYGLGESVVSGDVDPDVIEVTRALDDSVTFSSMQIGGKGHKIILTETGTRKEETDTDETNRVCLSEPEILNLGNIAVLLDETFEAARDVEWAIRNDVVYLLQSRPITTINQWTNHELLHEMDTPVMSETEMSTIANAGEVFPGATSVLTESIIVDMLSASSETRTTKITHHHTLLDILGTLLQLVDKELTIKNKVTEAAVIGHSLITPELHALAVRKLGHAKHYHSIKKLLVTLKNAILASRTVNESVELSKNFRMKADLLESAADLHRALTIQLSALRKMVDWHCTISSVSVLSQVVVLSILAHGRKDLSEENLSDLSEILMGNHDVISADIPASLKKISTAVSDNEHAEEFVSVEPEKAADFLKEKNPTASLMLQRFLKRHAHRGIKELDLVTEVWGINPTPLVKTIQALVKNNLNPDVPKSEPPIVKKTPKEIVDQLKTPINSDSRFVLKYLVSLCQKAVANRETTKSSLLSVIHQFRLAYRKLGQLLVSEGLLPEMELVFHLTHYEILKLIKTKNAGLCIKARRRQRLYPEWEKINFPELMIGLPKPIKEEKPLISGDEAKIRGTVVYPGNVMAKAVVISDIKDISLIKKGDILITHSTDVGWSPCFPLLGGIVTELGGLISHGAVVAREYGLPCLVGVQNATKLFKTGDAVLLSGSNGVLQKVSDGDN